MKAPKQQKKQSKVAPINTTAFTGHWGTPQGDEYKTPKDQIWGDVIRHERILERNWNETWIEEIEEPAENAIRQSISQNTRTSLPFYRLKPSPELPVKASGVVGWRGSDHENSLEFFKTQYVPQKKRFVQEQYGYYRIMKYFKEGEKPAEDLLPQKFIKPTIKRILC